eukprot:TRINITY_DN4216_c0_g1_i1.p1 TRINITY_DN4216_c0_g1~~TRINITY_DN4216_c0_g1_i1.p1  ORF type:complete len:546 (-),score=118.28 TRINITY_DN4216_c0_g1_i1:55-1620(-)
MGNKETRGSVLISQEKYLLHNLIGHGRYSKVFAVEHAQARQFRALKQSQKSLTLSSRTPSQVLTEAEVLLALRHTPFVVPVYALSQDHDYLYTLMELCPGGELGRRVKNMQLLEPQIRNILAQILVGVSALHEKEIVHRDLNLSNVLIDKDGFLCLSDFHTSHFVGSPHSGGGGDGVGVSSGGGSGGEGGKLGRRRSQVTASSRVSVSGESENGGGGESGSAASGSVTARARLSIAVSGQVNASLPVVDEEDEFGGEGGVLSPPQTTHSRTPSGAIAYQAPEVLQSLPYSTKADMWSFGVMAFELAHQKLPFPQPDTTTQSRSAAIASYIATISSTQIKCSSLISRSLSRLILDLLDVNSDRRLSASEVMKDPFFAGVDWAAVRERHLKPLFSVDNPVDTHESLESITDVPWHERGAELITLSEQDQASLKGWNFIADDFGVFSNGVDVTEIRADLAFFESVQQYPHGYEVYLDPSQSDFIILKALKDLPKGRIYYTSRGTHIERIKEKVVIVGRTHIKIK